MRIVNAPHLRTKKLFARDKRRADFLMEESVSELASGNNLQPDGSLVKQVITSEATRRHAAYLSYGHWLVRRLAGESDGPAILALWRLIAWDPRGGMRRDFELRLDDFRVAEEALLSAIRGSRKSIRE